jgi:MGT family glycosyltransferase
MPRGVFFNIPASGHINPSLPLVRELMAQGHEVIYVNTEETRAQIEVTGARFVPYPVDDELTEINKRASGGKLVDNALALAEIGARLIPFCLELLRREQPDYVIYDSLCAWAKQTAAHLSIKAIASHAVFAINPRVVRLSPRELLKMAFNYFWSHAQISPDCPPCPSRNRYQRRRISKYLEQQWCAESGLYRKGVSTRCG